MKKAYVVTGIVTVLTAMGSQACTLGSDTIITTEQDDTEPSKKDAGANADAQSLNSGASPGAGAATCSGGTYATPDVSKLTACGGGKGHCYAKEKTPYAEMLGACPNANEVCVPDEVLAAGGNRLKQCKSIIGDGGCITLSLIPAMEADPRAKSMLKQDVCDAGQVCAPCINPEDNGAPTPFCQPIGVYGECKGSGAPAADAGPTAPPKPLEACCTSGGKSNGVCISEQAIPEAQRDEAPDDSCSTGNKCVPKAIFEGKPVVCNAGMILGKGVCLDECFNSMMGLASDIGLLWQDRCASTEVCVPCSFMKGKGITACD